MHKNVKYSDVVTGIGISKQNTVLYESLERYYTHKICIESLSFSTPTCQCQQQQQLTWWPLQHTHFRLLVKKIMAEFLSDELE